MKTIVFAMTICLISTTIISAKAISTLDEHGDKYCAKMKNGKLTMMHEGKELTADVTLDNGTRIKTDGTVVKKDGTKMTLKKGECVDREGKMAGMYKDGDHKDHDKDYHKDKK